MKWIKHMTSASRNEKLARLIDEHGVEGYGFYWLVLETIGEQVDENGQVSVKSSPRFWRNITNFSAKKFRKLAETCATLELFSVNFFENEIEIICPNILKYCDEWTKKKARNSGVTPDKLRPSLEVEVEVEVEKKKEPPKPPEAGGQRAREKKPKSSSNGKNYSDDFLRFWEVYPKKSAKRDAWKAWGQMKKELPDMDTLLRAVAFAAESTQWTRDQGQFIPFPATWLRRAGWEDETLPGTSQRRIEVLDIPSGESNPYNHKPGDPVGLHFDKLREIVAAGRLANGEGGE